MFRGYSEKIPLVGGHRGTVTAVAFSPYATYLATAGLDCKVCIWEMASNTLLCVYQGDSPPLSLVWVPHRDDRLLCGLANGYVTYLSFSANVVKARGLMIHTFPVECLAINGSRVASAAHRELRVWDWQGDGPWYHLADIPEPSDGHQGERREVLVTSVHWTEEELIATYLNHGIRIFETRSWNCTHEIASDCHIIRAALSSDGTFLLASNLMTGFDLHNLDSECVMRALGHDVIERRATPIRFIESDRAAIGGSTAGATHIWDVHTGRRVQTLDHAHAVLALDAHHDRTLNRFIIATGMTGEVTTPVILWTKKDLRNAPSERKVVEAPQSDQRPCSSTYHLKLLGAVVLTMAVFAGILIHIGPNHNAPSAIPPDFYRHEDPLIRPKLGPDIDGGDEDEDEDMWDVVFRRMEEGSLLNIDSQETIQQGFEEPPSSVNPIPNARGDNLLPTGEVPAGELDGQPKQRGGDTSGLRQDRVGKGWVNGPLLIRRIQEAIAGRNR